MREILFRGKNEKGEWVYGAYLPYSVDENVDGSYYQNPSELPLNEGKSHTILEWNNEFKEPIIRSIKIYPATVGQYTGVKGAEGKKIFDGDIVGCSMVDSIWKHYKWRIYWWNASWILTSLSNPDEYQNLILGEELSILGNIHDNPSLLEDSK